ncbi:T9SS type A sorting domain-containing protein [Riemerella anatipestifer]|uniref:T9SS type A sorting domain-containing protein n=1 Tax=Riemerella anatipestifer TaxID=34085 RepID=UPI001BD9A7F4|nr:T9SS type A sorting domain-containing protein [Riemerella anatipestifer]MBT0563641.1 T9SS type A sorting domain-containing protein [Riemerella anatipestifer]
MRKFYSLMAAVALVTTVSAQNLVQNPGLENWNDTGKAVDWFHDSNSSKADTKKHSGSFSGQIKSPSKGSNSMGMKDIAVTPGKTYVYSGWYLQETASTRVRHWGQWRTATGLLSDTSLQSEFIDTTSSEWKQFKIEAVAPEGAEVARLSFRVYKGNDAAEGAVYIDDFFFADKETLSVTDIKDFNNSVKFNTLADDVLTFSLPNKATVNIYSLDGKLLSSSRVSSGESINISHPAKGNYIVTVQDNYNKISRKIIKK